MAIRDPHRLRFSLLRLKLAILRAVLRRIVHWQPMANNQHPGRGYDLVLAAPVKLLTLLEANLRFIERTDRTHLRTMRIVIDQPASAELESRLSAIAGRHPTLDIQFHYFTRAQALVLDLIQWGWAYGWLSWCLGLKHCRSSHLFIHDLDLLPLAGDFFESRFRAAVEGDLTWVGIEYFQWNSVTAGDRVMPSNELLMDAAFARDHFQPIDFFAVVTPHLGRWVCFDLTHDPQRRAGARRAIPYAHLDFVHPSQMVSQFTAYQARKNYAAAARSTLLLLPYYLELSGDTSAMIELGHAIDQAHGKTLRFFGKTLDLNRTTPDDVNTLAEMAYQIERAIHGYIRPHVGAYFNALAQFADPSTPDATPLPHRPAA